MNAVNFNRLANQTVGLFNDKLIQALSPLQKKIAAAVLVVFSLLAVYFYCRCFKTKSSDTKIQEKILSQQQTLVNRMSEQIKNCLGPHPMDKVESAVCFVKMGCKEGNIKQQYIFKNLDGSHLTKENCENKIDKAVKIIKDSLNKDLGLGQSCSWLILFKKEEKEWSLIQGSQTQKSTTQDGESHSEYNESFSSKFNIDALRHTIYSLKMMGMEPNIKNIVNNGEFVIGEWYKELTD